MRRGIHDVWETVFADTERRVKSALVYVARSAAKGTPSHTCGPNTADAVTTDSILYNFPRFFETNDESATLNN